MEDVHLAGTPMTQLELLQRHQTHEDERRQNAGSSTGTVTRRKVVIGEEPQAALASSSAGFMCVVLRGCRRMNTNGTDASAWQTMRPPMVKTLMVSPSPPPRGRAQRQIEPTRPGSHEEDRGDAEDDRRHEKREEDTLTWPSRPGRFPVRLTSQARNPIVKLSATVPATNTSVSG